MTGLVRKVLSAGLACVLIGFAIGGAAGQGDPGEALYRVGRQLIAEGKLETGMRTLDQAIAANPAGPFADDALLAAAMVDYPAGSLEELGGASAAGAARAAARLARIASDYRQSDAAPAATFRLGLLKMDPSNPAASIDEAFATFLQVPRLYPRAPEAADAIEAAAICHALQGDRAAAALDEARLLVEWPASAAAKRATLRLARSAALLGEPALGRRLASDLVADPAAAVLRPRAQALLDLLARASGDRAGTVRSMTLDPTFSAGQGLKEIAALAVGADGRLRILEAGTGRVLEELPLLATGSVKTSAPAPETAAPVEGALGLALGMRGMVIRWDERGLVYPKGGRFEPLAPGKTGEMEGVRKIGGVALGPFGEIDLIDLSQSRILRYSPDRVYRKVVATFESRPDALARTDEGTLHVLFAARREVVRIPVGEGSEKVRIPLEGVGWRIASPDAIAVDPLGRLHVLDASAGTVTIFDPAGARVAQVAPARGAPGELKAPTALAVDEAGLVYVADRRAGRVLRFR